MPGIKMHPQKSMPPGLQSTLPRSQKQAQTQIRLTFLQPSQTLLPE